ncbi:MAG: hypothetical protein R3C09_20410 [Pirellulaceae bacterium]
MAFLPIWFMRLLVTFFIFWLLWSMVVGPWLFSSESAIKAHYWWMFP